VLILGTLPGTASLARGEYYAQPRNGFWSIMGEIVGAGPTMPYDRRRERLIERRIALWDVCAHASRPGSADAAIDASSIEPNPLGDFLQRHRDVCLVCFNGARAAALFQRRVLHELSAQASAIPRVTLPSTSAAYASMPLTQKVRTWRAALAPHCIDER
jgi:hypoxanthine-DNA glycosylase